jgi:hypothetical protein
LKPAETVDVTLGGNRTEITGQLVAENQPFDFDYHYAINYLVESARIPPIKTAPLAARSAGRLGEHRRPRQRILARRD